MKNSSLSTSWSNISGATRRRFIAVCGSREYQPNSGRKGLEDCHEGSHLAQDINAIEGIFCSLTTEYRLPFMLSSPTNVGPSTILEGEDYALKVRITWWLSRWAERAA